MNDELEELSNAISVFDDEQVVQKALTAGHSAEQVRQAVLVGLERARKKLLSNHMPVAEFLLCLDTTAKVLATVADLASEPKPLARNLTVVLGVVAGDPHDLGKDIVAAVYRAHGFTVVDLGRDVPQHEFIAAVQRHDAALLGLSVMMSTTMSAMKEIIPAVRAQSPQTAIIVGGACLNQDLARAFGADGYAESALTLIEVTDRILSP